MKVEMRPAYEWTCDECGRNQFESAMLADFSEEDRLETAKQCGLIEGYATEIPDDLTGDFVTYPEQVTCKHCGTTYETKHYSEDEYDGESTSDEI